MTKEVFMEKVWSVVEKVSRMIIAEDSTALSLKGDVCHSLFQSYEAIKANCKSNYFKYYDALLDHHKIASCVAGAVLKCRPIEFRDDDCRHKRIVFMANEFLAVMSALVIMRFFNAYEAKQDIDLKSELYKFPDVDISKDKPSYLVWLCIALSEYKDEDNKFNILLFSNLLFLIEQYSLLKP